MYLSGSKQAVFDTFRSKCPIFTVAYSVTEAESLLQSDANNLLIVDDFLVDITGNKSMNDWITKFVVTRSHHENTAIIMLMQNLFGKNTRTLSLNCSFIVLMKTIRDKSTTSILSRQFSPNNPRYLTDALALATDGQELGRFLVIDCQVKREDFARVRDFIWLDHPNRNRVFLPL